jgi:hypothetical protein
MENVFEISPMNTAVLWRERKHRKYQELFSAFGFFSSSNSTESVQAANNWSRMGISFSYILKDEGSLIEQETRLQLLISKLAPLILDDAHEKDGLVSFATGNIFAAPHGYHVDTLSGVKKNLQDQLDEQAEIDALTETETLRILYWALDVPTENLTEGVQETLQAKLLDVKKHWAAKAREFELMIDWNVSRMEIAIDKKRGNISFAILKDDYDSILPLEKRVEFFIKKVVMPDIKQLEQDGYSVTTDDKKSRLARTVSGDEVEQALISTALMKPRSINPHRVYIEVKYEGK